MRQLAGPLSTAVRGPYDKLPSVSAGPRHFGAFIAARRIKRQMTQRQYADRIGISLRSMINLERLTDRPAYATGVLATWACLEFGNEYRMLDAAKRWMHFSEPKDSVRRYSAAVCWFDAAEICKPLDVVAHFGGAA